MLIDLLIDIGDTMAITNKVRTQPRIFGLTSEILCMRKNVRIPSATTRGAHATSFV